jgi:putative methyltransferase (TIGR04325 family)
MRVARKQARRRGTNGTALRMPQIGESIDSPYFHGLFTKADDAPNYGSNPFDQCPWIETTTFRLRQLMAESRKPRFLIEAHLWPFVSLSNVLCAQRDVVRILDIGGGMGDNFVQFNAALPEELRGRLEYHIVDTPQNCEHGAMLLSEHEQVVTFHSPDKICSIKSDASIQKGYDLLLICGTLQFMDPWCEFLSGLSAFGAGYICITRTPMNDSVPTFYTTQFLAPSFGPWSGKYIGAARVAVINPQAIINILTTNGYEVLQNILLNDYRHAFKGFPDPYERVFYNTMVFSKRR